MYAKEGAESEIKMKIVKNFTLPDFQAQNFNLRLFLLTIQQYVVGMFEPLNPRVFRGAPEFDLVSTVCPQLLPK